MYDVDMYKAVKVYTAMPAKTFVRATFQAGLKDNVLRALASTLINI